ncbi:DUF4174 domain-containing protein [Paracoccus sp. p4-l81]|uniref:DUF4174 domain-containing protein n=1 Tax=Paracoccus sp. p4-l81 TaxID=3342806 RepID=UPI0035B80874
MRALILLMTLLLTAAPVAAFDRPTRPTAPPPGIGPVTRPMANPPAGMAGTPAPALDLMLIAAGDRAPGDFLWQARPVVVFADTPEDPQFLAQMRMIAALPGPLVDRRVVIVTDTDPAAGSDWRRALHPRGFSLVVIDTDGRTVTRKPLPWSAREIARTIDKLPSRREELGGR